MENNSYSILKMLPNYLHTGIHHQEIDIRWLTVSFEKPKEYDAWGVTIAKPLVYIDGELVFTGKEETICGCSMAYGSTRSKFIKECLEFLDSRI